MESLESGVWESIANTHPQGLERDLQSLGIEFKSGMADMMVIGNELRSLKQDLENEH